MLSDSQMQIHYQICKEQAACDGAYSEELMTHWFQTAWDICATFIGMSEPRQIEEEISCLDNCGNFRLSFQPSSNVEIFDGYQLVMVLPPSLQRSRCDPAICCLCHPKARYTTGRSTCEVPPRFLQAVARLFTFMVDNRGDTTDLDSHLLERSGAMTFLEPDVLFAA